MPSPDFHAPRFTRERAPVKDALVEFFVHSKASSGILRFLSTKRKPVCYSAIRDEIRFSEKEGWNGHDLPKGAIHVALAITRAAGLVRLTRQGFFITEAGRDVQRRMPAKPREASISEVSEPRRAGISTRASRPGQDSRGQALPRACAL